MPYIKPEDKDRLCLIFENELPQTPGELNFVFSAFASLYFNTAGRQNYQAINDIIGALEGAKIEFYRRVAVPYETKKIAENGDVY